MTMSVNEYKFNIIQPIETTQDIICISRGKQKEYYKLKEQFTRDCFKAFPITEEATMFIKKWFKFIERYYYALPFENNNDIKSVKNEGSLEDGRKVIGLFPSKITCNDDGNYVITFSYDAIV